MTKPRLLFSLRIALALGMVLGLGALQSTYAQEPEIQFPVTVTPENGSPKELTLGLDPEATDSIDAEFGEVEQPPVPPGFSARLVDDDVPASGFGEGLIVDIRPGSAEFTGTKMYEISFQASLGTDLTISWDLPSGLTGTIKDEAGGEDYSVDMSKSDSVSVNATAPDAIVQIESTTIPVELTGLDAQFGGDAVRLTWQTASETNNAGFYIQRKRSNDRWQRLGFVESSAVGGTTNKPHSYRFRDSELPYAADSLTYRLRQVDTDGTTHLSEETVVQLNAPEQLVLQPPFPNPARQHTTLRFETPTPTTLQIEVYDLLGRRITTLVDGRLDAGRHTERLSTSPLTPGVYFVRLQAGTVTRTQKLTVAR